MTLANNFTKLNTPTGDCWLRNDAPVWIRSYEAIPGIRLGFYQAYKAVVPVPKGRDPWTVDNRRIGDVNHGFITLDDAMNAALEVTPCN